DHVQVDDVFGLAGKMCLRERGAVPGRCIGRRRAFGAEQGRERREADGIDAAPEELPARFGLEPGLKRGHDSAHKPQDERSDSWGFGPRSDPRASLRSSRGLADNYLFNTSSRFISSLTSIVHVANVRASSDASGADSPTVISLRASASRDA